MEKDTKLNKIPAIIAIILLLATFFNWPYGYYSILRIVVTAIAIYYAYCLYENLNRRDFWFWLLIVIVILFNPIFPVYIDDKGMWGFIDVIVSIFFAGLIFKFNQK